MMKSASTAALFGALLIAAPLDGAAAQMAQGFTLKTTSDRQATSRLSPPPPRVDPLRFRDGAFEEPFDLFGIPVSLKPGAAITRERGLSFSVRPVKGVRAVARLRF